MKKEFARDIAHSRFHLQSAEHRVPSRFRTNAWQAQSAAPLALQLYIRYLTGQKLRD
jgi:hypothetical protein